MNKFYFFILYLFFQLPLFNYIDAQNVDEQLWRNMIEEWAELNDSESVPDEIVEELQGFIDNPINLNDTSSTLLLELPFITELHRDIIKAYIAQNGQMVTMAELNFMNGFDSIQVKLLSLFAKVEHVEDKRFPSIRQILSDGHSNLRIGMKSNFPRSRGYEEEKYMGSPLREYFRYQFHYQNRIVFQFSGDKDAGESFRFAPQTESFKAPYLGFDYYGYHLMVSDIGIVKSAIVGKYQLQFGQGATLWSGFAPWGGYDIPLRRYGQGIRPASAFCEYGFLRGAAATMCLIPKRLEATLFYSFVNRDCTMKDSIVTSIYNSGYHRSNTEMSKKWQLGEHLAGTHIQYRHSNLNIGTTFFGTFFSNEIHPTENIYNTFTFRGKQLFNAGIDATWRYRRTIFFGEIATSMEGISSSPEATKTQSPFPLATVAGFQTYFNSNNILSVAFHYGSESYHNFFANTIGQSSSPQNETGIINNFQTQLPFGIRLSASADIFRFPGMRYRLYAPSVGADYRIRLSKNITQHTQIVVQYQLRNAELNSDLQTYAIENTNRQRFSFHLDYNRDGWRLQSRVVFSQFYCMDHNPEHGFLMLQDISRTTKLLGNDITITARAAIFDVTDYNARIYISESDMIYEFSAPMLVNKGIRCYFIMRYDLLRDISIAFKYSISYYPDEESLGSGYDTTVGNLRQELKAQLRLRF
ncbi:MAG: hypothetical protein K6A67_10020 [Bacteroidales bacterium]|nr:hypothetical protein [Bacteroidales bacterium]